MSIEFYFKRPCCLARMRYGPLGAYIDQYGAYLQTGGFPQSTGRHKLRLAVSLSVWLNRRQLCTGDLDEACCEQFLKHRARTHIPNNHDRIGLRELLAILRTIGRYIATCSRDARSMRASLAAVSQLPVARAWPISTHCPQVSRHHSGVSERPVR